MLMAITINANGSKIVVDKVYYELETRNNTATVCTQNGNPLLTNAEIQRKVYFEDREFDVVGIMSYAFENCTNLVSVIIPPTIAEIPRNAFENCTSLKKIDIPDNLDNIGAEAFLNCSSLSSISLPSGIKALEFNTFKGCSSLTTVILNDGIETIGTKTFDGCVALEKITLPASLKSLNVTAFLNCTSLKEIIIEDSSEILECPNRPNPDVYLGGYETLFIDAPLESVYYGRSCHIQPLDNKPEDYYGAFKNQKNLKAVAIGPSVNTILSTTFNHCEALQTVTILCNNLKIIEKYAFWGCKALESFDMPKQVEEIGIAAFDDCSSLQSITIPASVRTIGGAAFSGCSDIKEVIIEDSPETLVWDNGIGSSTKIPTNKIETVHYGRNISTHSLFKDAILLTNLTFGNDVTKIGANDFYRARSLESVTLPAGLVEIGNSAFSGCSKLSTLKTGTLIERIGAYAFIGTNLSELPLGPSLTIIGEEAFSGCPIETLTIPETLTEIGTRAFSCCEKLNTVSTPKTLTAIPDGLFYACYDLKNVYLHDNVTLIGESSFYQCGFTEITLPAQLEKIGDNAFNSCYELSSISIPDNVKEIGTHAFRQCKLNDIELGSGLEIIGMGAFEWCNFNKVEFPDGLKEIKAEAFNHCPLADVVIPASVETIGHRSFSYTLKSLTIKDGHTPIEINNPVFYESIDNLYIGRPFTGNFQETGTIGKLIIGNLVPDIPMQAFSNARIGSVEFGSGLRQIHENAFSNCNLSYVVIPPFVETIGDNSFANNRLYGVYIGYGITDIGSLAFNTESESMNVYSTSEEPPTARNDSFGGYSGNLVLASYADTESFSNESPWNLFSSIKTTEQASPINQLAWSFETEPGDRLQLNDYLSFDAPYDGIYNIFWESSNPEIALVDNDGVVTVLKSSSSDCITDECEIRAYTMYKDVEPAIFQLSRTVSGEGSITSDSIPTISSIYNIQGICIKQNGSMDDIRNMPAGIYIFNGKKIMKK